MGNKLQVHAVLRTQKTMDPRLIILFTVCLTKGVFGFECWAKKCTTDIDGNDVDCVDLGSRGNVTECGFFPCMKATGKDSESNIKIQYCGYDEAYSKICEKEDGCRKKSLDFMFKSNEVDPEIKIDVKDAKVCCCTSGDRCNGAMMEENSGTALSVFSLLTFLTAFLVIIT